MRGARPPARGLADLSGKGTIVTGGASGLGYATAKRFLEGGANVVIADYNPNIADISAQLRAEVQTGELEYIRTDVSKEEDVEAMIDFCVQKFGHVDVVVASAGIGGAINDIANETIEDWNRVNLVDYTGVMLTDKHAVKQMIAQGTGGSIINLASMFGLVGSPDNVAYSAAKGGVVNLTKSAGSAYAKQRIRVN